MIDRLSSANYTSPLKTNNPEELKVKSEETTTSVLSKNSESKEEIEITTFPRKKVEEIVEGMNKFLQPTHTSLKFEFHEKLNEYYVSIVDDKTNEVVREIPSKKLLDMYAAMTEFLGLIVDKKI